MNWTFSNFSHVLGNNDCFVFCFKIPFFVLISSKAVKSSIHGRRKWIIFVMLISIESSHSIKFYAPFLLSSPETLENLLAAGKLKKYIFHQLLCVRNLKSSLDHPITLKVAILSCNEIPSWLWRNHRRVNGWEGINTDTSKAFIQNSPPGTGNYWRRYGT